MPCFDNESVQLPLLVDVALHSPDAQDETITKPVVANETSRLPAFSDESLTTC